MDPAHVGGADVRQDLWQGGLVVADHFAEHAFESADKAFAGTVSRWVEDSRSDVWNAEAV